MKENSVDWVSIKRAVKIEPLLRLKDFLIPLRKNLILKTGYKSNATWYYLSEFNNNTKTSDFLQELYGNMYPNLEKVQEQYKNYDVIDIIFDESLKTESIREFRNLFRGNVTKKFKENSTLIFAKQTKSIKHLPNEKNSKIESFPNGTPILMSDFVYIFYLTKDQWDQCRNLLSSLIEMESFSYLLEFASVYGYSSNFDLLKEACTSGSLNSVCNYESLETLGDTVLKTVYTLHIFLNKLELNEFKLTRDRG